MANHKEEIAGLGIIAAALMLIYNREYELAMMLLLPLIAFFVGEKNGKRQAETS